VINILIADSNYLSRLGLYSLLATYLDFQIVCQSENSNQVIIDIKTYQPEIVIIDLHLQPDGALQVITECRLINRKVKFLVLANDPIDEFISEVLIAGASGCIQKNADKETIVQSIREILVNQSPISPSIAFGFLNNLRLRQDYTSLSQQTFNNLTKRELVVLKLLTQGMQNKFIGNELHITERTVEAHVRNILKKLNATNRTHAAIIAVNNGWLIEEPK
jgi:two-component system, NarL family, response regulator DegU